MSLRLRRGSPATAPPPSVIFGPTLGAQFVRDHAGPLPVTNPGGGVPFSPVTLISTLIASNPSNTIFVASQTGTYPNFRGINYSNKHPRFYFPGNALTDYNITGTGALDESGFSGGSAGVEIYGGKWTGYGAASSSGGGAIRSDSGPTIIQDAYITGNGRSGIALQASVATSHTVRRCKMLTNGRYNITCNSTPSSTPFITLLLENCWMEDGNSNNNDPGGDAGCMKLSANDGTIVRNNWSKGNHGYGIWFDAANRNITITDNVIENNVGLAPIPGAGGLFYEVSYGGTVIEHNYLTGNGDPFNNNYPYNGVQIQVSNSPCDGTAFAPAAASAVRSEIRYNDIDTSNFQTPISLYNHSQHPDILRTRNWYVHHNRMYQRGASGQSRVGLADDSVNGGTKVGDIGTSPGAPGLCLFDFNEYHVADINGSYWEHDTARLSPGARTWVDFQSRGHEAHGTRVVI